MASSRIVVVGASSGGLEALRKLVSQLPADFAAPVFVVQHLAPDISGKGLVTALDGAGPLRCEEARHGAGFEKGCIYVAPPDRHLMLTRGKMQVTRGARENRSRPAIDPLFRSAAVAYRSRVIGVVLTGYLDDGTAGMVAIQRCGGVCVVQDPNDAAYPDMPRNVMARMKVDHVVPVASMGALLCELLARPPRRAGKVPKDLAIEAQLAARVLSDMPAVEALGDKTPLTCPSCGGVLWEVEEGKSPRFRCHVGHAFTGQTLLGAQTTKLEETLWAAMRMFEERRNLLTSLSARGILPSTSERAKESETHIQRLRAILTGLGE